VVLAGWIEPYEELKPLLLDFLIDLLHHLLLVGVLSAFLELFGLIEGMIQVGERIDRNFVATLTLEYHLLDQFRCLSIEHAWQAVLFSVGQA